MLLTKAQVLKVHNKTVEVYCPYLTKGDVVPQTAVALKIDGVDNNYSPGDIVFVDFEDNSYKNPVVIGCLKTSKMKNISSSSASMVDIDGCSNFPENTLIYQVKSSEIKTLEESSINIPLEIKSILDEIFIDKSIVLNHSKDVQVLLENTTEIENDIKGIDESIERIRKDIGKSSDKKSRYCDTVYANMNNARENLANIRNLIGMYSRDEDTLKDKINDLREQCQNIQNNVNNNSTNVESQATGMLGRAEKIVNVVWTPKTTFTAWNNNGVYKKGKSYIGMPYTQATGAYTFEEWEKKRDTTTNTTINGKIAPTFGSCCADFVSDVLGLGTVNHFHRTVSGILEEDTYLTRMTGSSAKLSNVKPGDVLVNAQKGHTIWVGAKTNTTITIYEQTPSVSNGKPLGARKTEYQISDSVDSSTGCFKQWAVYPYVLRPNEKLLSLPCNSVANVSTNAKWNATVQRSYGWDKTEKEAQENMVAAWSTAQELGWSKNAFCAIWGNIGHEGGYNPWSWESGQFPSNYQVYLSYKDSIVHGYGLVGYTYASKYIESQNAKQFPTYGPYVGNGKEKASDGDAQLRFLDVECKLKHYYWDGKYTYSNFIASKDNAGELAKDWMIHFERPANQSASAQNARATTAMWWYNNFDSIIAKYATDSDGGALPISKNTIFMGDSLTAGMQSSNVLSAYSVMAKVSAGIWNMSNGNSSFVQFRKRLESISAGTAAISIMFGTNDATWSGTSTYKNNYLKLLHTLLNKNKNMKMHICTIPPCLEERGTLISNACIDNINEQIKSIQTQLKSEGYNVTLKDVHKKFIDSSGNIMSNYFYPGDGVHMCYEGYKMMSDFLKG